VGDPGASERPIEGGCECGGVAYLVAGPFLYALNCHCSKCRAATGSAFKPVAGIERDKVTLAAGEQRATTVAAPHGHDVRCGDCGSLLYSVVRDGEYAHVAMGSLRSDPGISPQMHIYVGSKAPWHQITDELPQFEELPD
jgi:hypothetical protein